MDLGFFIIGDPKFFRTNIDGWIGQKAPILDEFVGYGVGYLVFHETKRSYDIHVTPCYY